MGRYIHERRNEPDISAIKPAPAKAGGKTSRRFHARSKGREPRHLVSTRACRQRVLLAREAVGDKSNEIVAIALLLERLALSGALVTIDAIGAPGPRSPGPSCATAATICSP